jgi:spoIIIJ-associated protein
MNQEETLEFAQKYVADLIAFFGVNADVEVSVEDEMIAVSVSSTDINSLLIGRNAETLRSMQLLVSQALRAKGAENSRVNIDIAGYKKRREEKIEAQAREWIEEVRSTGDSHVACINAADRRVVHRVAGEYSDIRTFSEGEGRDRRIVIAQQSS